MKKFVLSKNKKILRVRNELGVRFENANFFSPINVWCQYEDLMEVELTALELTEIPTDVFGLLINVQELRLNLPKLEILPNLIFSTLTNLKVLILNIVKVFYLHYTIFYENKQLRKLHLCSLAMFFDSNFFKYFRNLEDLEIVTTNNHLIRCNDLDIMLECLSNLKTLRSVMLFDCDTPEFFKVRKLNLNHSNTIELIYLQLFENLAYLNLSNNELELRSLKFHKKNPLKVLILFNNYVRVVRSKFFDTLANCHFMDFENCGILKLQNLKMGIKCPNLARLSFRNNKISEKEFGKLCFVGSFRLQKLDLSGNLIRKLPNNNVFGSLITLKMLYLNDNEIEELPEKCFASLQRLQFLDLSDNYLRDFHLHWFNLNNKNTYDLQILKLNSNFLRNIFRQCLKPFPKLRYLDLSDNIIGELSFENFKYVPLLQTLKLSSNALDSLRSDHFGCFKNLQIFELIANPITAIECDTFFKMQHLKSIKMTRSEKIVNIFDSLKFSCVFKQIRLLDVDTNNISILFYK